MSKQFNGLCWIAYVCVVLVLGASVFVIRASAETYAVVSQGYNDQFITPLQSRVIPGRVTSGGEGPSTTSPPTVPTHPVASIPHVSPIHTAHNGYVSPGFLVTTTSNVQNFQVQQYLGLVEGAAVRQPTWNEDASAGMQEAVGGSLDSYAQMQEEARTQAFTTLVTRAKEMGANAVIGVHFDSQSFPLDKGHFATGVTCVGTAVIIRPSK